MAEGARAAAVVAAAAAVDDGSAIMQTVHSIQIKASPMKSPVWSFLSRTLLMLVLAVPTMANAAPQETFATPEAAVDALVAALKADSDAALVSLFGEEHKSFIVGGDRVAAQADRARILAAMQRLRVLRDPSPDRRILVIGDQAWPMPIPIVKTRDRWRFATEQGIEELENRRIGGNERNAIYVLRAYVEAQRVYGSEDRNGDGVRQFARKLASSAGQKDGLYWPSDAAKGEEASPFGPLVAESATYLKGRKEGDPFHGYRFRILTQQGASAPGGAYNYIINGRMIAGYGMVAYPAVYGETGVMTFIVNHNGVIYQRDLGAQTAKVAGSMNSFDPSKAWTTVAQP